MKQKIDLISYEMHPGHKSVHPSNGTANQEITEGIMYSGIVEDNGKVKNQQPFYRCLCEHGEQGNCS